MLNAARQETLKQLGIDVWLPSKALPGAKEAPVYALKPAPDPLLKKSPESTIPASGGQKSQGARSAASLWQDNEQKAKPVDKAEAPAVRAKPASAPSPAEPAVAQEPTRPLPVQADNLELHILDCPGQLLLVDEAHQSLQQAQLLGNMLFALGQLLQQNLNAQPVPFSAVELSRAPGVNPQAVLEGLLQRRLLEAKTPRVLLMGDIPGSVLATHFDAHDVQVVSTVSSAAMLAEPACKATVWQQLQAFRN